MATEPLIVTVGFSESNKIYTVYKGLTQKGSIEFCNHPTGIQAVITFQKQTIIDRAIDKMEDALYIVERELRAAEIIHDDTQMISAFGIKIAAPGSYFMQHRFVDESFTRKLKESGVPLDGFLANTIQEVQLIKKIFSGVPIFAVSDSAYHAEKPDVTWNYDIDLETADRYEIKRFGYNGIANESVVQTLGKNRLLEPKVLICHLDSVCSVTAVQNGKSTNNSFGFSYDEGAMSAHGTSSISLSALEKLAFKKQVSLEELIHTLRTTGGLTGIAGTANSIEQLHASEKAGEYRAKLALDMYVRSIQKLIGSMSVELGGVDQLVFTGTHGTAYPFLRKRIVSQLAFLGFAIDPAKNKLVTQPELPTKIHQRTRVKSIYVVASNESYEMAWRTRKALTSG